jgi:ATP-dependent DNA ligase
METLAVVQLAIPALVQWLIGILGTGAMGYSMYKGAKDTNRQLRMGEKSLEMEDTARKEQLTADKEMNVQKKSMTERYMAEANKEKSKERNMLMMQMAMQERQSNNEMLMGTMGGIAQDVNSTRPDMRYLSSLLQ